MAETTPPAEMQPAPEHMEQLPPTPGEELVARFADRLPADQLGQLQHAGQLYDAARQFLAGESPESITIGDTAAGEYEQALEFGLRGTEQELGFARAMKTTGKLGETGNPYARQFGRGLLEKAEFPDGTDPRHPEMARAGADILGGLGVSQPAGSQDPGMRGASHTPGGTVKEMFDYLRNDYLEKAHREAAQIIARARAAGQDPTEALKTAHIEVAARYSDRLQADLDRLTTGLDTTFPVDERARKGAGFLLGGKKQAAQRSAEAGKLIGTFHEDTRGLFDGYRSGYRIDLSNGARQKGNDDAEAVRDEIRDTFGRYSDEYKRVVTGFADNDQLMDWAQKAFEQRGIPTSRQQTRARNAQAGGTAGQSRPQTGEAPAPRVDKTVYDRAVTQEVDQHVHDMKAQGLNPTQIRRRLARVYHSDTGNKDKADHIRYVNSLKI